MTETTKKLIRLALEEDIGRGDVTTDATIPEDHRAEARVAAKEDGVFFGGGVLEFIFRELDPDVEIEFIAEDGMPVQAGAVVARLRGRTRAVLTGERTALNFLQRLSGVATLTSRYVKELEGTDTRLLDTRKTTPGMRELEKAAVASAGGVNHRMGLYDMALIKDNHITAAGGVSEAVAAVRENAPDVPIEVEVTNLRELDEALVAKVDRVMLDNMTDAMLPEAVRTAKSAEDPPEVEVSGNVTLATIRDIAELGPDFISVGALTHSARALDISLEIGEEK